MKNYALLTLAGLVLAASPAAAQTGDRLPLPPEITYPEGIAYDPATNTITVAGSADGRIARIALDSGAATLVGPGLAAQRPDTPIGVLGLKLDSHGRLWMAGRQTGHIYVMDTSDGRLLADIATGPGDGLMNDLVFAGDRGFFTDSRRPVLWSVDAGKPLPAQAEPWLRFEGTALEYAAEGANLNGIAATADGRTLITGQMNKGLLFKIDVATRAVTPIDLGGERVEGVDGVVLDGTTLYIVRQPAGEIVTIALAPDLASGKVVKRTRAQGLGWPATAAVVGDDLLVVNTQFDKRDAGNPDLPFSVQRVPLAELAPAAD